MGKARHLPRYGAQAETGIGRIISGFELAIIKAQRFADPILQIEFAILC